MKITELKCTACNGTLKIDENNPHTAVCEYCNTRYVIEEDGNQNVHLSVEQQVVRQPGKTGRNCILAGMVSIFFWIIIIGLKGVMFHKTGNEAAIMDVENMTAEESSMEEEAIRPLTGALAVIAERALSMPAADLSDEELSRIKWLEMKYSMDAIQLGYSLENPYEDTGAELEWLSFPRDDTDIDFMQLPRFTGLKKLNVAGYLPAEALKGLNLEGLGCYAGAPSEIAGLSDEGTTLKELIIGAGLENLSGLNRFQNVEKLTVEGSHLSDIKDLVNMKSLKSLNLKNCDEVNDFSVLSVMPWLEELSIESEGIRDIGFLSGLPNLRVFSLSDAKALQVNDLKGMTGLTSLTIDDCDEIKDLSGIEGLSGLNELDLDVPYNCVQPDLAGLSGLTKLSVSGVNDVEFLRNMKSLESLELDGCSINSKEVFSGLTGLKRLSCFHISGDLSDFSFINQIPSLEYLDLSGISTYEDISGLFGIPTLQELYLNGAECEINFDIIKPNEALKILEIDGIKLYTNVKVSGSGGIYYVDYDKVTFAEHTDFLLNFPGLKELSLADNTLTELTFASSLPLLESLDISGNYVTDLRPLENLTELRTVFCAENPIENYRVLRDNVTIIQ